MSRACGTYVGWDCIQQMDFQTFPEDSCIWGCDSLHHIWLLDHKCRDTDLHICSWYKLCFLDSQYSRHIQVDTQHRGLPGILADNCRFHCCTEHLDHRVMDCRDLIQLVVWLEKKIASYMLNIAGKLSVWLVKYCIKLLTWWWSGETAGERVSCVSFWTSAYGCVVDDTTLCPCSTRPRTWITTLLSQTSQVTSTFRTDDTLWSTVGWTANICGLTWAWWCASYISTLWIGSTGWWYAWVYKRWWWWCRFLGWYYNMKNWILAFTEYKTNKCGYTK